MSHKTKTRVVVCIILVFAIGSVVLAHDPVTDGESDIWDQKVPGFEEMTIQISDLGTMPNLQFGGTITGTGQVAVLYSLPEMGMQSENLAGTEWISATSYMTVPDNALLGEPFMVEMFGGTNLSGTAPITLTPNDSVIAYCDGNACAVYGMWITGTGQSKVVAANFEGTLVSETSFYQRETFQCLSLPGEWGCLVRWGESTTLVPGQSDPDWDWIFGFASSYWEGGYWDHEGLVGPRISSGKYSFPYGESPQFRVKTIADAVIDPTTPITTSRLHLQAPAYMGEGELSPLYFTAVQWNYGLDAGLRPLLTKAEFQVEGGVFQDGTTSYVEKMPKGIPGNAWSGNVPVRPNIGETQMVVTATTRLPFPITQVLTVTVENRSRTYLPFVIRSEDPDDPSNPGEP